MTSYSVNMWPALEVARLTFERLPSLVESTSEQLMERYVDGEAEAFEFLYRRVSPNLMGYLLRLTRNRERAEDLLQITFSKIHRARGSFLKGAPVLPWILAIARRSFLDERRSAQVRTEDLSPDGSLPEQQLEDRPCWQSFRDALEVASNT